MTTPTPKPPKQPTPVVKKEASERGLVELTRTFSFITPLFGGGVWVNPDENQRQCKDCDPITLARGNAIRGQLRFWWRATHGLRDPKDGRPHNLKTLREREDALWGNASLPSQDKASKVNLRLEMNFSGTSEQSVFKVEQKGRKQVITPEKEGLGYAAFPLQPKSDEDGGRGGNRIPPQIGKLHKVAGHCKLVLTCPSQHKEEIEDTLDAWLTFGGLGGRTRRGFGAVAVGGVSEPKSLFERLKKGLVTIPGVSGLADAKLVFGKISKADATEALDEGLKRLKKFRQSRNKPPYGPSHWPEPEAIRRLTGCYHTRYSEGNRVVKVDKFPRAAFGMPIIFHFKDTGEPGDTCLTPEGLERRASSLFIRPFRKSKTEFGVFALVLHDPEAKNEACVLKEQDGGKREFDVATQLTTDEARRIRPLNGKTDVLQAFLDYF